MSLRKTSTGYSGIFRGSLLDNSNPEFSYPYSIQLNNNGLVKDLKLIDLNYDELNCCTELFRNVYANGIEDPRLFMFKK